MNAPDLDPLTKLARAVRVSERMKGVTVDALGPRLMPLECAPPRVLFVPESGPLVKPDHTGNVADVELTLRADCLGRDYPQAWEIVRRVICAVEDYTRTVGDEEADTTADGVSDCLQWMGGGELEFDDEPDTARDGVLLAVRMQLRASFERTSLAADAGTGTVEQVYVTRLVPEEE